MNKGARNTIIALSALAAVSAVAAYGLSRMVVDMAIKRDAKLLSVPQKLQNKITGGLASDPNLKTVAETYKEVLKLPTETVTVKSRDGLQLTGHLYKSENQRRVVIAMHGWRSSWEFDFGSVVEFYNGLGCTVIYADQRGQNNSDGEYIGFGILERHDCVSWIEYAASRFGKDVPIYLLGVSMGASTVLMSTGLELPEQVKGVVADCGFTSPKEIWHHVVNNNLRLNSKISYPIINRIVKRLASFEGDEYSTLDAMETNTRPILFIHGSADNFVPLKMSVDNYLACKAPKDLLIVPGAGHGMSYLTDKCAYERAVKRFFRSIET